MRAAEHLFDQDQSRNAERKADAECLRPPLDVEGQRKRIAADQKERRHEAGRDERDRPPRKPWHILDLSTRTARAFEQGGEEREPDPVAERIERDCRGPRCGGRPPGDGSAAGRPQRGCERGRHEQHRASAGTPA
jgi:hypothetical protein